MVNNMMVSKRQKFHFWVNYSFKVSMVNRLEQLSQGEQCTVPACFNQGPVP